MKVINLKGKKGADGKPNVDCVYIGRSMYMGGWKLEQSIFANPYKIGVDGDRDEVLRKYREYVLNNKPLIEELKKLKGRTLGCWCKPEKCHGDVLVDLLSSFPSLSIEKSYEVSIEKNYERRRVACNKLPFRFGDGDKKWPTLKRYANVNCCSSGGKFWSKLSPFNVGPVVFTEKMFDGTEVERTVTNLENLWQASKVEKRWVANNLVDPPPKEWWKRRKRIWSDPKGHRHVIPKDSYEHPSQAYLWWQGRYMLYGDARKVIYIPKYVECVQKTEAWKRLSARIDSGENIQILGYDGREIGDDVYALYDELCDVTKPFGHELVLVAMLRKQYVWLWTEDENGIYDEEGYRVIQLE